MRSIRGASLFLAAFLGLLAPAACATDLFHATDWTTGCDNDPTLAGCPHPSTSGGGATSASTTSSAKGASSASTASSTASSSATVSSSSSGMPDVCDASTPPPDACCPMQYMITSGPGGSGNVQECCNGTDVLVNVQDCSVGMAHHVTTDDAQCGSAHEDANNGGDCCVTIICIPICPDA